MATQYARILAAPFHREVVPTLEQAIEVAIKEGEQPGGEGFYRSVAASAVMRLLRERFKGNLDALRAELGE